MKNKDIFTIAFIVIFSASILVVPTSYTNDKKGTHQDFRPLAILYETHGPILISGNSGFHTKAAIEGWDGNGSQTAPYLIDGYSITGNGAKAISINNTNLYFQVSNCLLTDGHVIIELNGVQNAIIYDNSIIEGFYAGIMIASCSSIEITNNYFSQNGGYDYWKCSGFLLSASSNINCSNNIFINHPKSGIYTSYGVTDCTFEKNTFLHGEYGLNLGSGWTGTGPNTYHLTVTDNYLENNTYGIRISEAGNSTYERNVILHSSTCGFYLWHTSHNLFMENNISSCGDGIQFDANTVDFLKNNTWFGNRIQGSQNYGIWINGANGVIFRNNSIVTSNNYGISLQVSCFNALFEYNVILDNYLSGGISTSQAFDSGTANVFSHNHWNDWTADADNDGVADNPYSIDGGINQDLHPLATPDGTPAHLPIPTIIYPNGGEILSGSIIIEWTESVDSLGHDVTYTIYYSSDDGASWILIMGDLTTTTLNWDTTTVVDSSACLIKLLVNCSEGFSVETILITNFVIDNSVPNIVLVNPQNDTTVIVPSTIELSITDYSLEKVWFNWDSGINQSVVTPYQLDVPSDEGYHWLTVYAIDSVDHLTFQKYRWFITIPTPTTTKQTTSTTTISTSTSKSAPTITPAFKMLPSIMAVSVLAIVLVFKRWKR